MGRIGTAFRAFFGSLFNRETAARVGQALHPVQPAETAPPPKIEPPKLKEKEPARSEALTLLAALQREARLVDFAQESLEGLSDTEIGAAVRDIHRNLAATLNRMFAIQPVLTDGEGSTVNVPAGFDAGRYRLIGNVSGQPPFRGILAHHGWEASVVQLPEWSGNAAAAKVIAPAEVELK